MPKNKTNKKMNTRLLKRIIRHIEAEPRRFAMSTWIQEKSSLNPKVYDRCAMVEDEFNFPKCKTAACIGGWACILSGVEDRRTLNAAHTKASKLLGLSRNQAERLFYADRWPTRFEQSYMNSPTVRKRVTVAVKRIKHFMETDGAE